MVSNLEEISTNVPGTELSWLWYHQSWVVWFCVTLYKGPRWQISVCTAMATMWSAVTVMGEPEAPSTTMVAVVSKTSPEFNANNNSVTVLPTNAACNVPVVGGPVPTVCVTVTPALFKRRMVHNQEWSTIKNGPQSRMVHNNGQI